MNKEIKTSPVPIKSPNEDKAKLSIKMDFGQAMKKVLENKKIARLEWPGHVYGFLQEGVLMIFTDSVHQWIISDGDLTATDWVVVNK